MNSTTTNIPMVCQHCHKPVVTGVYIGAYVYHEECVHGPGWQRDKYVAPSTMQPGHLTEADVRRIVREEMAGFTIERAAEAVSSFRSKVTKIIVDSMKEGKK